METKNNEMENRDSGKNQDEKYIHVNDIPTENWDDDDADDEKTLEEKTEKDQSQGDETVGIP